MKKLIIGLLIFVLFLVAALTAIPYFFKDQLLATLKTEINKQVNAEVEFEDLGLSIWKNFPQLTVSLEDLVVTGNAPFEGRELANIKSLDLSLDLIRVITQKEPFIIESIGLVDPKIDVLITKKGIANYDIALPSTETASTSESGSWELALSQYSVENGSISYMDRSAGMNLSIQGLNHEGSGNLSSEKFDMETQTDAKSVSFQSGSIAYLNNVALDAKVNVLVDLIANSYTLKDNDIRINALRLLASGKANYTTPEDLFLDFNFEAPSSEFKEILSLIPAAYTQGYEQVKADGKMALNGNIKGIYNETSYPAFDIKTAISNASFQYPDLPLGFNDIQLDGHFYNKTSKLDNMVVDLKKFNFLLDKNPVEGHFTLKTPVSNPDIDGMVIGKIDLEDLAKAFPLEGVEKIKGTIDSDVTLQAKQSDLDNGSFENAKIEGALTIDGFEYNATNFPDISLNKANMRFTPRNVIVDQFTAKLGKSDFTGSASLDNLLAYFSPEGILTGKVNLKSTFFDVNEWLIEEEVTTASAKKTEEPTMPFDRYDFIINADVGRLLYDVYDIRSLVCDGQFSANKFQFNSFEGKLDKSDFKGSGNLTNVYPFLYDSETLKGSLNVQSNYFDTNYFLAEKPGESTPEPVAQTTTGTRLNSSYFGKLNLDFNTDFKRLDYDVYKLSNLKGKGTMTHDGVTFQSYGGRIGKSDFNGSGTMQNLLNYIYDGQTLTGKINLNSDYMDVYEVMGYEEGVTSTTTSTNSEESAVVPVPEGFDLAINANIRKLKYDNINLSNLNGKMGVKDEVLSMNDVKADMMGGNFITSGSYGTKDLKKPEYNLKYKINNLDIKKAYSEMITFQQLAPLAQFFDGKLNLDFNINGGLKENMMPDLKNITMDGFMETIEAVINNFKPANELSDKLNIDVLKSVTLKNTKNWFTVEDGMVVVKPATFTYNGIDFKVGGKHSIDQNIDYDIDMKVPAELMQNAGLGKGLDFLSKEAGKLGLNLGTGSHINLKVNLSGNAKNPKVKITPVNSEGKDMIKSAKDKAAEVTQQAKDSIANVVKGSKEVVKEAKEEVITKGKETASGIVDDAKNKAKEALKNGELPDIKKTGEDIINGGVDSLKDNAKEIFEKGKKDAGKVIKDPGGAAQDKIDEAKQKAKDLLKNNPFKKKKGGN